MTERRHDQQARFGSTGSNEHAMVERSASRQKRSLHMKEQPHASSFAHHPAPLGVGVVHSPLGGLDLQSVADAVYGESQHARLITWLVDLLHVIIEQPTSVSAVWHPLGCLYVELLRTITRSIRLHVWDIADRGIARSPITVHSHDFDLHSLVLTGSIENRVYSVARGAPTHQIYDIEYHGDINILRPTGSYRRCIPESCSRISQSHSYTILPGEFHQVQGCTRDLTSTFVVADLRPDCQGPLLGPVDGRAVVHTVRRPCPQTELVSMLTRLVACARH